MHKYAEHIAKVARELWGDENKRMSHGSELRFGSHGSKSVDTEKGTWFDHETQEAGGFIDLCKIAYPEANGHMVDFLEQRFGMEKDQRLQKRDQVTVFDYIGAHGVLDYQVLRTDFADGSKTFRQRRPDGQGGWVNNLKDVRKIPYNLPEVLHRKDRWVWVVEGEKCVEALREIGIVATTNNGGSGNWSDDLNEWFQDRKIIVVPDNDEAGQKHAAKVVNQLLPVAKEIRVLDLSDELGAKGDIVDWLASGKTKEQLAARVKAAQPIGEQLPDPGEIEQEQPAVFDTMAIGQLLSMPPVKFLVEGLCTRFGFSVMYGPPGCGKTFIALDMALCVATGRDFHGMSVDQGAVLYIAGEGVGGLGKRIRAWIENRGQGVAENEIPFDVLPTAVNLTDAGQTEKLIQTIRLLEERRGISFSMVVVDTVARALLGADENSATDVGKFVKACDSIREAVGCAVLGIHHSGKDGGKGMRGSSALLGAVDTSIKIKKSGNQLTVETEKQKDAEPADDVYFEMTSAEVGTIGGETSVYLVQLSADQVASGNATLNQTQLKAMNCLRDATIHGVVSPEVAKDSFTYWLAEKEGLDPHDRKTKDRGRKAWKRALDALVDADIVSCVGGGGQIEWVKETQKDAE